MLNELESAATLYIIKEVNTISHLLFSKSNTLNEIIVSIYYLALYVKECYNDDGYFKDLIHGQFVICDLYNEPYSKWKEDYIKTIPDISSIHALAKINEIYDNMFAITTQPIPKEKPINEMISYILKSSKKPKLELPSENPISYALKLEEYKCENYINRYSIPYGSQHSSLMGVSSFNNGFVLSSNQSMQASMHSMHFPQLIMLSNPLNTSFLANAQQPQQRINNSMLGSINAIPNMSMNDNEFSSMNSNRSFGH
jgi:hypothetical protein